MKIDKFHDEFGIQRNPSRSPSTQAEPNSVLKSEGEGKEDLVLSKQEQKEYRSGTAVLLHMMRWSRVETMNAVRECSRFMTSARNSHMKALKRIMQYVCGTRDRGLFLKPSKWWDGKISYNGRFEFEVNGKSDSEYAKDESRHSVNGWSTWIFNCCVTNRSKMMPVIALSVTEAELYAAVQCAQDLIFIWRLLLSLGLEVKLPMILEIDNRGAFDFINGWSVSGRCRHIEVKQYFLRELKEAGIIKMKWTKGEEMTSDIFTKNLSVAPFEKHGSRFYGEDQYYEAKNTKDGQETNQDGIVGSTRTTSGLEGADHAAAATNIAVPIISLDDARKEYNYYQEVFGSLIEAPNK